MSKFFVKANQIKENKINIEGEDVNHIKNVLRLNISDKINICDSDNSKNYECEITNINSKKIECIILNELKNSSEGNVELHIYQGLFKKVLNLV